MRIPPLYGARERVWERKRRGADIYTCAAGSCACQALSSTCVHLHLSQAFLADMKVITWRPPQMARSLPLALALSQVTARSRLNTTVQASSRHPPPTTHPLAFSTPSTILQNVRALKPWLPTFTLPAALLIARGLPLRLTATRYALATCLGA